MGALFLCSHFSLFPNQTCGRQNISSSINNSSVHGSVLKRPWLYLSQMSSRHFMWRRNFLWMILSCFCFWVVWALCTHSQTHTSHRAITCLFVVCLEILSCCVISILPPLDVSYSLSNSALPLKYQRVWTACSPLKRNPSFLSVLPSEKKCFLPPCASSSISDITQLCCKSCCVNVINPFGGEWECYKYREEGWEKCTLLLIYCCLVAI